MTFNWTLVVNDMNLFGRTYRVTAQADAQFRDSPKDLYRLKTRSNDGDIVPLASLVELKNSVGPDRFVRYNLYSSAAVQGSTTTGFSSGESIAAMERLADEILPPGMDYEWTELAYQQKIAGGGQWAFVIAILLVFFVLVAQYENWTIPMAIMMIVPLSLSGGIAFVMLRGFDNNILTQIGFVVLIGLAAKNAILIVEFAKQKQDAGLDRFQAAIEASRLRLRPILMTAFSFILGVIPLVAATGAGAEMRQALGTVVFGGMLGVTLFGIFMTPVFYVLIQGLTEKRKKNDAQQSIKMKKILIINVHPDKESYNFSLSEAYKKGAIQTNARIDEINISDLNFNPNLEFGYRKRTELEPDLKDAIAKIKAADHLVWFSHYGGPAIQPS